MNRKYCIGIDIGGTNVAYGIVTRKGEEIYTSTEPTNSFVQAEDLIQFIFKDSNIQKYHEDIIGIGIGAPNGNYFHGSIEFAPNLKWKGIIPLAKMFQEKFNIPCFLSNDANLAAVGEKLFGNAQDLEDFVEITLGTGVGSGVYIQGKLVHGHDGFAGEYGHIRVIPNGRACGCGRNGCLETYTSSTGVVRSIHELESVNKEKSNLLTLSNPSAKDVFNFAAEGDLFSQEIVDYTTKILGSALADFLCFSSPKAYVLFGGIAQSGPSFAEKVKTELEKNALVIYQNKVEIRVSSLHNRNAGILGAASLAFTELSHKTN